MLHNLSAVLPTRPSAGRRRTRIALALCALAAAGAAAPAGAAVLYTFSETGAGIGDATFTYLASTFITANTTFAPTTCVITPNANTTDPQACDPMTVELNPTSFNVTADYLGFNSHNIAGGGSGTAFFFFAAGSFGQVGVHQTISPPDACTPGHGCVGNAAPATLTVSLVGLPSAVPEPSTWATMAVGFGAVGAGLRRRRPVAATA